MANGGGAAFRVTNPAGLPPHSLGASPELFSAPVDVDLQMGRVWGPARAVPELVGFAGPIHHVVWST